MDSEGNWATERGNRLEPVARAVYEISHNRLMEPRMFERGIFRASLDGYNSNDRIILEIKCPGEKDHELALSGKVPEKYYPQLQHQLLVTVQADEVHYWSFMETSTALVVVRRDREYQARLETELTKFWELVVNDKEPSFADKDFVRVNNNELLALIDQYQTAKIEADKMQKEADLLKDKILTHERVTGRRVTVSNRYKINLIHRKGSVNYAKVPELKGVDLEQYRGKGSSYQTIKKITGEKNGIIN